jgi:DNA-binding response OmpR family regulator
MRPLAIIESDATFASQLRTSVEGAGFRTECFDDAQTAVSEMRSRPFSLAILDLADCPPDPYRICRELSDLAPLITVLDECQAESCVRAFESGADDCVIRTVPERELVARVRNVLRRAEGDRAEQHLASVSISLSEMRVRRGEQVLDLTRGETELVALLLEHAPAPLTPARAAQILAAPRSTVETRIKSLRAKLGPGVLISRGRIGYQLLDRDR